MHPLAGWGLPLSLLAFVAWESTTLLHNRHYTTIALLSLGWLFLLAGLSLLVAAIVATHRQHRSLRLWLAETCPDCGYDLRATPHRCPECGLASPLDEANLHPQQ